MRSLLVALACLGSAAGEALAAAPTLTYLNPPGAQRGSTVTISCGGKFDWPVSVSAPGVVATPLKDSGKIELQIPANLAADRIWIRLFNAEGTSKPAPFLIGSLDDVAEKEPNNAPREAQRLDRAAVTINGALGKADVDGFAVDLLAGQTVVAALDANERLGAPMDAILQVAAADGFVLAENHDDVGLDPRLAFTAKVSGTHIIRVFAFPATPDSTIAFRGGDDYVYRLTITTGPFITHTVPMSAPSGPLAPMEVAGWNIPPGTKLPVVPLASSIPTGPLELEPAAEPRIPPEAGLGIVYHLGFGGAALVRLVPFPVIAGLADQDADHPLELTLPAVVTGRLTAPRELDRFQIPLRKGEAVVIAAEGRGLHFPVDPVLKLLDPSGKDAGGLHDPATTRAKMFIHKPTADGVYQLSIRDLARGGGSRAYYQITVRPEVPDFELTGGAESLVVTADKPAELEVKVQRRGEGVGAITIAVEGLPAGVTAEPVVCDSKSAKVTLKLASTGPAFSGPIRIRGTTTEPRPISRLARTPEILGANFESFWLTVVEKPPEKK